MALTDIVSAPVLVPRTFEISAVSAISRYSSGVRLSGIRGALAVIFSQPALCNFPCFIQCSEQIKSVFLFCMSVEPFDKGILRWLAGPDKLQHHTMLFCPLCQRQRDQFGPLSIRIFSGYPRFATILSSTLTTRCAGIFRSISIASASRLKSSTTLKVRKRLPHTSASCIKSMDQLWFIASGVTSGTGLRTGRRCFLHGENSVSAGSKSGERLWFQLLPACAASKLLNPYRG